MAAVYERQSAPLTLGAPVYRRGDVGHVVTVAEPESVSFTLGTGRMERSAATVAVVFEGGALSEGLPSGIVAPWLAEAARMGLQPISEAEAAAALARAQAKRAQQRDAARLEREEAERVAAAFKLEAAAKMPAGAKAVIVAELMKDDCDSMSDYFNATVQRRVILAWSSHTRDLFPELRKAALNFAETADLADAPESAEHREKYSMGAGYYLKRGHRYADGWRVQKVRLYDHGAAGVPVGEWSLPVDAAVTAEAVAPVSGVTVEAHTHTTKGFAMWIVCLADRVERSEYDRLLSEAKARRGWWSRAWQGTPAGFAFKDEAAAHEFAALVGGTPPDDKPPGDRAPDPAAAPAPAVGERLRSLADAMQGSISAKFADRLENTPKRQREAQSQRLEGYRLQRTQAGLRALADLHDAGAVPPVLAKVATKAAAYALARAEITSSGGYYDAGRETGEPAEKTPAALAFWALLKPRSAEERAADALREKVAGLRFANIPGYFPTPAAVVSEMLTWPCIMDGTRILEPEAGSGTILDAVKAAHPGAELIAFERHHTLRQILEAKGYQLAGHDFMESDPAALQVDVVLMNPPFENGQDIDHVRHAFEHLKPGGRLVAIMSPGPFYRSDRKAAAFREWFDALGGDRMDIPAGAFRESGTDVATVRVVIDRP